MDFYRSRVAYNIRINKLHKVYSPLDARCMYLYFDGARPRSWGQRTFKRTQARTKAHTFVENKSEFVIDKCLACSTWVFVFICGECNSRCQRFFVDPGWPLARTTLWSLRLDGSTVEIIAMIVCVPAIPLLSIFEIRVGLNDRYHITYIRQFWSEVSEKNNVLPVWWTQRKMCFFSSIVQYSIHFSFSLLWAVWRLVAQVFHL